MAEVDIFQGGQTGGGQRGEEGVANGAGDGKCSEAAEIGLDEGDGAFSLRKREFQVVQALPQRQFGLGGEPGIGAVEREGLKTGEREFGEESESDDVAVGDGEIAKGGSGFDEAFALPFPRLSGGCPLGLLLSGEADDVCGRMSQGQGWEERPWAGKDPIDGVRSLVERTEEDVAV